MAVLTGTHLKRLGGEGSLSSIVPYDLPQQWSLALHEHPVGIDGFVYVSRHLNTERAVILFERAGNKLTVSGKPKKFEQTSGHLVVLQDFNVVKY